MSPEQRSALYALVPAVTAVLVVYGVMTEEQAVTVGGAVLAALTVAVAFVYRPTKDA